MDFLASRGYERYEVSNFAIPGQECRHNIGYWQLHAWLGLGPSAVSNVWYGRFAERRTEVSNLVRWLDGHPAIREELSTREFLFEHFLMGWRMAKGFSAAHFESVFGIHPLDVIPRSAEKLFQSGFLREYDSRLYIAPHGLDILNSILIDVLSEIDTQQFRQGYNWP